MALLQIVTNSVPGGLQDEDLLAIRPDTDAEVLGGQEVKSYLFVVTPEDLAALSRTLGDAVCELLIEGKETRVTKQLLLNVDISLDTKLGGIAKQLPGVQANESSYFVDYSPRFSAEELEVIRGNDVLPDGPTSQGGNVVDGVVFGLFTNDDIQEKV